MVVYGSKGGSCIIAYLVDCPYVKKYIYIYIRIYSFLNKLVLLTKLPQKQGQQGPKANPKPWGPIAGLIRPWLRHVSLCN